MYTKNTHFSKKKKKPIRLAVYTIDLIFDFIKANPREKYFIDADGNSCKLRRAKIFLKKGIKCIENGCCITGNFFALDLWPDGGGLHLDLFGYNEHGDEIMLTIDHKHPKSLGGKNSISNYDTLCKYHNARKGNKVNVL